MEHGVRIIQYFGWCLSILDWTLILAFVVSVMISGHLVVGILC